MATENNTTPNPAVGAETPPAMLSPEEIVQELRALKQRMPLPLVDLGAVSRKGRLTHVDSKFVEAAISALGVSNGVQQLLGRTDEQMREEIDTAMRWTAVADELRQLLHVITTANAARRQRIGLTALQAYNICQQVARDRQDPSLDAYIAEMRRLNKFGRRRKRPDAAAQMQTKQSAQQSSER